MPWAASLALPGAGEWACAPLCRSAGFDPVELPPGREPCESGAEDETETHFLTQRRGPHAYAVLLETGALPAAAKATAVPGAAERGWETMVLSRLPTWPGREKARTQLLRHLVNSRWGSRACCAQWTVFRQSGPSTVNLVVMSAIVLRVCGHNSALPQLGGSASCSAASTCTPRRKKKSNGSSTHAGSVRRATDTSALHCWRSAAVV